MAQTDPSPYRAKLTAFLAVLDKLADDPAVSGMDDWTIERVTQAVEDALAIVAEEDAKERAERIENEADELVAAMLQAVEEAESES